MKRVCAGEETVRGIDISRYENEVNWKEVVTSDVQFCFIKASEGAGLRDHSFSKHWDNSSDVNLLRGAYHFFRPEASVEDQVNNFLSVTKYKLLRSDLPAVLDWEVLGHGDNAKTQKAKALEWLERIEASFNKTPLLYLSPGFFNTLGNPPEFKRFPLWVANFGARCPSIPEPFDTWTFWQYSETGRIKGIEGNVDTDLFNGNLDQLKAFANQLIK